MKKDTFNHIIGHSFALFTVFVWGITFVSSKILLEWYSPLEIMVLRFTLAYIGLFLLHPKLYKVRSIKEERIFLLAGLTGVSGYFLAENSALVYTSVSNTGLILAGAPLFVAIVTHIFTEDEHFHIHLLIGFVIAMTGVALVIFNGQVKLQVNLFGDFLALLSGVIWAFYSLAVKKMDSDYSPIFLTRRTFFYGVASGAIMLLLSGDKLTIAPLLLQFRWGHIAFLGFIASATCFVMWNVAIRKIGAVKASNYIYLIPLFTMAASYIVLREKITILMLVGGGLILIGVCFSERGDRIRKLIFENREEKS